MFSWADLGSFWKNTGMALYHKRFSGSLLDLRYQNKNKFKPTWKQPSFAAAANFSAKTAQKHILSLSKSNLYDSDICGQSYKAYTIVIYDSTVIIWGIFKSGTTLES